MSAHIDKHLRRGTRELATKRKSTDSRIVNEALQNHLRVFQEELSDQAKKELNSKESDVVLRRPSIP